MNERTIYVELAEKLGVPNSERFVKIMEASFTPLEATICRELFEPATALEVSAVLGMGEKEVAEILDTLVDKGALTRGETQFAFHPNLLGYHHDAVADTAPHAGPNAIPEKVKELWADFFRNEWSYQWLDNIKVMMQHLGGRSLPIWPAIGALEKSPNIKPEDLLPEENWKARIEMAERRIVGPCGCRIVWGTCDYPMMTCFSSFDKPRGVYYLNKPGRLLKEYTLEETLGIVRQAEESGLVHWGDCYCCEDCCESLFPVTRGKRYDLMTPNRFLAVLDEDKCTGCQACLKKCKFEAIEMKKPDPNSKKQKAVISTENCKGCGLCIVACKQNALHYEIVRPPEHVKGHPAVNLTPGKVSRFVPVWGHYELE